MKTHPMLRRPSFLRGLFCLCIVGTALPDSRAQQAPAPGAPPAAPAPSEEVVKMSPFEVSADEDVGYLATNTLAGSRFSTALKDTPASISVLTSEFLSDLGAYEIEDALAYAGNIEFQLDDDRDAINGNATFQSYQEYRVRGLNASRSRNYFTWNGPAIPDETAFIERIEDARGANAVLFGVGSPGGVINTSTKQANVGRAFQKGSFTYGRYDSKRATIDLNQPLLDGKLAVRLNLVYNKQNTFRHFEHQEHQRAHLAVTYKLTDRTKLRAEFERGQLETNKPRSFNLLNRFLKWDENDRPVIDPPAKDTDLGINQLNKKNDRVTYISNDEAVFNMKARSITTSDAPESAQLPGEGATTGLIIDRSIADFSINVGGPAQNRFSRYGIFESYLEHQLGQNTFVELGYRHQDHSFDNRDPRQDSANSLKGDPNLKNPDGTPNPHAGQVYLETNWFRTARWSRSDTGRITLSHELDAGKWGNYRFAALGEYDKSFFLSTTYREFWVDPDTGLTVFDTKNPENAKNNVWRRSYPVEGDWRTYYISGPEGSGGLLSNVLDPISGKTLSSAWLRQGFPNEIYSSLKSALFVTQARYFDNRLIASLGLRRDEYDEFQLGQWDDPVTKLRSIARNPADADSNRQGQYNSAVGRTKTLGLVYHAKPWVPWLSVFYNRADNVALPAKNTILPPSGEPGNPIPPPSPQGETEDFGVGLDLLDGKLYAKATYYTTDGKQQSTTSPAPIRKANERVMEALADAGLITPEEEAFRTDVGGHGLFDHESDGLELEITANPTKNWRFRATFAKADAVEDNKFTEWRNWIALTDVYLSQFPTNADGDIVDGNGDVVQTTDDGDPIADEVQFWKDELDSRTAVDGLGKLGNRRYKVTLWTRYGFSSGWLKGAYLGGGYRHQSKMFAGLDADGNTVDTNSFWRADAFAGYTVQGLRKGRKLQFQLNVNNVFNNRDPLVTRLEDDGVTVHREVVQSPTTWKFQTSFEY